MSLIHRLQLLAAIAIAASFTSWVNASSPVVRFRKQLSDSHQEIEDIRSETLKLSSELTSVNEEIEKLTEEYELRKNGTQEKTQEKQKTLEQVAFLTGKLAIKVIDKNRTSIYLKELSERLEFELKLIRNDVKILKERRRRGFETKCFILNKNDSPLLSSLTDEGISSHNNTKTNFFSARSLNNDDTAHIAVLHSKIKIAKDDIFAAIQERERLKNLLQQKKALLTGDRRVFGDVINRKLKTLKRIEDEIYEIELMNKFYMQLIETYDKLIVELITKLKTEYKSLTKYQKLIHGTFRKAVDCYQSIQVKANTYIEDFLEFLQHYHPDNEIIDQAELNTEVPQITLPPDLTQIPETTVYPDVTSVPIENYEYFDY